MNVTELIDQTDARPQQNSHCDIRSSPHDVYALVVRILGVLLLERDHKLLKLIYDCFQHHPMPTSIRSRSTPLFQPHLFCHRIHSPCFDIKLVLVFNEESRFSLSYHFSLLLLLLDSCSNSSDSTCTQGVVFTIDIDISNRMCPSPSVRLLVSISN